jgi:hypothetical protein
MFICCKPFANKSHTNSLRRVTAFIIEKASTLGVIVKKNNHLCASCRIKLDHHFKLHSNNSTSSSIPAQLELPSPVSAEFIANNSSEIVSSINSTICEVAGASPIDKKKLRSKSYSNSQAVKVANIISLSGIEVIPALAQKSDKEINSDEWLLQLKAQFLKSSSLNEKIFLLTTLPQSWTQQKMMKEFGISRHLAAKAKHQIEEKGLYSRPDKRLQSLSSKRINDLIVKFYNMDDISYIFPGKADYKTVVENGIRVQKQKRMVLCNLREAHRKYSEDNINAPENKVGFSKFCSLRPEECILAGPKGTYSVCVCCIHQNFELMFDSIKNLSESFTKYETFLSDTVCEPPTED